MTKLLVKTDTSEIGRSDFIMAKIQIECTSMKKVSAKSIERQKGGNLPIDNHHRLSVYSLVFCLHFRLISFISLFVSTCTKVPELFNKFVS